MFNITEKPEKSCKNCIYYVQHYAIKKFRIFEVEFGHCKRNAKKKTSLCKFWAERFADDTKKENEAELRRLLQKINRQLEDIATILTKDCP